MYLGTDPEFVIRDPKGKPVPAHSVGLPDKVHPLCYRQSGSNMKAFRDGYNLEVNVDPQTCRGLLINSVRDVVKFVQSTLPSGYTIDTAAAYRIRLSHMQDAPEDVKYFGCDPSWDAYTGEQKVVKIDATTHPYRYAGGHLHFGEYKTVMSSPIIDMSQHQMLVKLFDLYIGLPLSFLYDDPNQWRRRKFYGQAGEYRPQRYNSSFHGIEYRVPPPQLFNHPAVTGLFYGVGRAIADRFGSAKRLSDDWNPDLEPAIRKAINTGKGAKELLPTLEGFYTPEVLIKLKEVPDIHNFQLVSWYEDAHEGWTEYAKKWRLSA